MAEAILYHIAGEIIKTLASGAAEKIGLWWGLNNEIEKLKNTVSAIQAVLLDAEERQAEEHQIKDWLAKLKEVMYDADDLLDDFSTEALQRQVRGGGRLTKQVSLFFSRSNSIAYGFKMGQKIKEIRKELDAISDDGQKFQFARRMAETRLIGKGRDQSQSFVGEGEVIGRDKDKVAILDLLLEPAAEENVLVVPIVGIGGLGKTALAQFVYNDDRVKDNFHLRMWVCVSEVFDVKAIVEKVIKSATNSKPEDLELDQLQGKLRKQIDGKKYLLVLDDIWNDDPKKWFELQKLLMCGATGSRIIVTTRATTVAMVTSKIPPYVLPGLSLDESWSLFVQVVFNGQEPKNLDTVRVGKEIVRKCAGVPLAIKTIASILYFKEPKTEWLPFMENELSKIPQKENDILPTLRLSYHHLPPHLKHCFAYCSIFPKDYEIKVETLIHLWIAQGFIQSSNPSQCLEEVGLEIFKDLLWRSFFQEVEFSRDGAMVRCKMHDLMHDLAASVSGPEIIISKSNVENVSKKTRHVSFDFNVDSTWKITNNLLAAKGLRTFLLPVQNTWSYDKTLESSTCEAIFKNLRKLRVLDLQWTLGEEIPVSIKKLKHLRYLDFSSSPGIRLLPDTVTKLQNLEVLKLAGCHALKELPNDIERLLKLKHLDCYDCYSLTHMPRGIGQLTSLQTLTYFAVAKEDIPVSKRKQIGGLDVLKRLNNLRGRLAIENLHHLKSHKSECEAANLTEKQHLESLSLSWDRSSGGNWGDADYDEVSLESLQPPPNVKTLEIHCYRGVMFPNWFSSLPNLLSVTLFCCRRCKQLPSLHLIHSLKHLRINLFPDLEYIDCTGDNCFGGERGKEGKSTFFPSLKTLELEKCPNLRGWWKKIDDATTSLATADLLQFPCLSILKIRDCPKLASMPLFPTLDETLSLRDASTKLLERTVGMKVHISTTAAVATSTSSSSSPSSASSHPLFKLKKLDIGRNEDVESLPEGWLQSLNSIRELCLRNCPNLKSLSHGLHCLTSLQILRIRDCPNLTELCGNNQGTDWPKIAHIPNIKIDGRKVQWEGRYRLDVEDVSTHFSDDSLF